MKSKIVFVDHPFHEKTGSSNFIKNLLSLKHEIILIYFDQFKDDKSYLIGTINNINPDFICFWQNFPYGFLKKIKCNNVTFFPMYDDYLITKKYYLKNEIKKLKVICFCRKLYDEMLKIGFKNLYFFQYMPPLNIESNKIDDEKSLFFWSRNGDINWTDLKAICQKLNVDRLVIHNPENILQISNDEIENQTFSVFVSNWIENQQDYLLLIEKCTFYLAPRKFEGIGMSFLEAMSKGKILIGFNFPTFNEYVTHEINGFLLNADASLNISLEIDFKKIQENSIAKSFEIRENWNRHENEILQIIQCPKKSFFNFNL